MQSVKKEKILGIRRENKNKWERRVALTPEAVKILVDSGIKVIVQPCNLRCSTNKQYLEAGAEIEENIQLADVIFGVKEIPLDFLFPNKTFIFFSHTFKGQISNMPALKTILENNIRLIDYELIKENKEVNPQRLVAFGKFAGIVGTIDFLQGIGDFLMYKKTYIPFLHTGFSYMYPSLELAKKRISKVGELLKREKINSKILPLVFAVTGNGRVAKGSEEILTLLPHKWIEPDDLQHLFDKNTNSNNECNDFVYLTRIEHKHMYCKKSETERDAIYKTFDKEHFYANKKEYKSVFAEKYLPFLSVIFHCMYWDSDSPVIISDSEARNLAEEGRLRLIGITDITCDFPVSSIELLKKTTTIENPFYTIDPKTGSIEHDFKKMSKNSILYHAVDHLPSELPFASSNHFSEKLLPFVKDILNSDYPCEYGSELLPLEIQNACETWNGKLCPKYEYLYKELSKYFVEYKELAESVERKKSK